MLAYRWLRVLVLLILTAAAVTVVAGAGPFPAQKAEALCAAPAAQGNWHNIDPNTRSMSRVVVTFNCSDQILCDENGHCTGGVSYFTLQPFGKCHPTDCDWGRARAQQRSDGWLTAVYNFGFKTSYVWVKTYPRQGRTYLRVWVNNHFAPNDGRADYTTDDWMLK